MRFTGITMRVIDPREEMTAADFEKVWSMLRDELEKPQLSARTPLITTH